MTDAIIVKAEEDATNKFAIFMIIAASFLTTGCPDPIDVQNYPPNQPTLLVLNVLSEDVVASWNLVDKADGYHLSCIKSSGEIILEEDFGPSVTEKNLGRLAPGSYTIELYAFNSYGSSGTGYIPIEVADLDQYLPGYIHDLSAQPDINEISLSWSSIDNILNYQIHMSRDSDFLDIEWQTDIGYLANQFVKYNLEADSVYYIRIRARNSYGYGPWTALDGVQTLGNISGYARITDVSANPISITKNRNVYLYSQMENVVSMQIDEGEIIEYDDGPIPVTLSDGDGDKWIRVRYINSAGTSTVRSPYIELDQTAPTGRIVQTLLGIDIAGFENEELSSDVVAFRTKISYSTDGGGGFTFYHTIESEWDENYMDQFLRDIPESASPPIISVSYKDEVGNISDWLWPTQMY